MGPPLQGQTVATVIASPNEDEGRLAPIRLMVIHTMEVPETNSVAEAVAGRLPIPPARCPRTWASTPTAPSATSPTTAWAAPGANPDGLQIELAGRAGQTTGAH
jgi:hypothetical protein